MKLLTTVGQLPGDEAVPIMLDLTRRSLELCRPFFRALLSGLSHGGAASIDLDCGFEEEVAQLKKFGLEALVAHVDPKIRNSEAHLDTEIQHAERKAIVRSRTGTSEYTYPAISETLKVVSKGVVPGLLAAFATFQLTLYLLLVNSAEYKLLLLRENQTRKANSRG